MTREISNADDVIDSRAVIERIMELESDLEGIDKDDPDLSDTDSDQLEALKALAEEASMCASDWLYGVTLIRDSYFEEYARELAEDIGAISGDESWPLSHIDWEAAADALKMDYTSVDFDGVTYWIR